MNKNTILEMLPAYPPKNGDSKTYTEEQYLFLEEGYHLAIDELIKVLDRLSPLPTQDK